MRYSGPDQIAIRADPDELHRAITNLIDNAVQHSSKVDVHLSLTGAVVTVVVADDGPGISLVDRDRMFEPFVRGDAARNMNIGAGFGLGLTIAKNIIEAHSEILTLHDREPHGLVAKIELPR